MLNTVKQIIQSGLFATFEKFVFFIKINDIENIISQKTGNSRFLSTYIAQAAPIFVFA